MAHDDDVLSQADALMRRHRSFVARSPDDEATLAFADITTAVVDDDEIPLLTEIVDTDVPAPLTIDAVLDTVREDIEEELSVWLVEVLPAAVANASQHILNELDSKARHTLLPRLREILAAHQENPAASATLASAFASTEAMPAAEAEDLPDPSV